MKQQKSYYQLIAAAFNILQFRTHF